MKKSNCLICKRVIVFDEESQIWRHLVGVQHSAYPIEQDTAQHSIEPTVDGNSEPTYHPISMDGKQA